VALLVAVGLLAVATGSLLVLTRRRRVARTGPPMRERPLDVHWVSRAELCVGQLRDHPSKDDAVGVLAEMRAAAADVDAINHALVALHAARLRRTRDQLETRLAAGGPELTTAHRAVSDRLATAERLRAARDALTTRMHACVTGLERVRDSAHADGPVPAVELVELRAKLAQVRVLATRLPKIPARGRP
jgi:hypothetical protein